MATLLPVAHLDDHAAVYRADGADRTVALAAHLAAFHGIAADPCHVLAATDLPDIHNEAHFGPDPF